MPPTTHDMSAVHATREVHSQCVDYLHASTRRYKKQVLPSGGLGGAAGLAAGTRYQGRETRLKGKGLPPADNQEGSFTPSIRVYAAGPCASYAPHNVLTPALPAPVEDAGRRPAVRQFDKASAMRGCGAVVEQPVPTKRMVRLPGVQHPDDSVANTQRRVLSHTVPLGGPKAAWEVPRSSSVRNWALPERSVAADTILHHHTAKTVVTDRSPRLDDARAPAPSVGVKEAGATRAAFFAAASDYYVNKARGTLGSTYNLAA